MTEYEIVFNGRPVFVVETDLSSEEIREELGTKGPATHVEIKLHADTNTSADNDDEFRGYPPFLRRFLKHPEVRRVGP